MRITKTNAMQRQESESYTREQREQNPFIDKIEDIFWAFTGSGLAGFAFVGLVCFVSWAS